MEYLEGNKDKWLRRRILVGLAFSLLLIKRSTRKRVSPDGWLNLAL